MKYFSRFLLALLLPLIATAQVAVRRGGDSMTGGLTNNTAAGFRGHSETTNSLGSLYAPTNDATMHHPTFSFPVLTTGTYIGGLFVTLTNAWQLFSEVSGQRWHLRTTNVQDYGSLHISDRGSGFSGFTIGNSNDTTELSFARSEVNDAYYQQHYFMHLGYRGGFGLDPPNGTTNSPSFAIGWVDKRGGAYQKWNSMLWNGSNYGFTIFAPLASSITTGQSQISTGHVNAYFSPYGGVTIGGTSEAGLNSLRVIGSVNTPRIYTDFIEATNASGLVLRGGNAELSIETGAINAIAPAFFSGLGTGLTGDNEAYGAGWNGDNTLPTKNAVYDKIETISGGSDNPWTADHNLAGYLATNASQILFTNGNVILGGNTSTNTIGVTNTFFNTIGGGELNTIDDGTEKGTISGGSGNRILVNNTATIGGGQGNTTSNQSATISGGTQNNAFALNSTVGGGIANHALGDNSTIPGGINNVALGDQSVAMGFAARALHQGAFVFADSSTAVNFDSMINNEFAVQATGGIRFVTGGAGFSVDGPFSSTTVSGGTLILSNFIGSDLLADTNAIPADGTYSLHYQDGTNKWSLNTGFSNNITGYFTNGQVRIIADGDSIMAGSAPTVQMPYFLTNLYLPSNWKVVTNAGVAGRQMSTMLSLYTNQIQPHLTGSPGTNKIVILEGGINDIAASVSASNLFNIWSNYVVNVHNDGALVLATTMSPVAISTTTFTATMDAQRIKANQMILASGMWDFIYDAASCFPVPPNAQWFVDHIHYTAFGYDQWAWGVNQVLLRRQRSIPNFNIGSVRSGITPTNTPAIGDVPTATDTIGTTKWAAPAAGGLPPTNPNQFGTNSGELFIVSGALQTNGTAYDLQVMEDLGVGGVPENSGKNPSILIYGTNSSGQVVIFRLVSTNSTLRIDSSVNGAAYSGVMTFGTTPGILTIPSGLTVGGNATVTGSATATRFGPDTGFVWFDSDGASKAIILDIALTGIGSLRWAVENITKTTNFTLVAMNAGAAYNNNGASGATTNTLPAATIGYRVGFRLPTAQILAIKAVGSDVFTDATLGASSAAGTISSSTQYGVLDIECNVAGQWEVVNSRGTWAY